MLALLAAAAIVAAPPNSGTPDAAHAARMAATYDDGCLHAFPDDAALDATMAARGARPLTAEQAKVTLVDDPGRGWALDDGGRTALVFLELPPFHACSVRFAVPSATPVDDSYRTVADRYRAANPGFEPIGPYDADRGDIHVHASGWGRRLPDGRSETLLVFDQTIADPARRARGETGIERRFVHQIVTPH